MSHAIPAPLDDYAAARTTPAPPHLARLRAKSDDQLGRSSMVSGPVAGRVLELLAYAADARRVLEVGTFSGYGALSMVAGMPADGQLTTLESDPDHAAFARNQIEAAGESGRIEILEGPALETMRTLEPGFDLIFIDADKTGYPDYVDMALSLLSQRGLLALDNTLLGGDVLDPGDDERARTIDTLNARLAADESLVSVLLTVRDGITVVRRR